MSSIFFLPSPVFFSNAIPFYITLITITFVWHFQIFFSVCLLNTLFFLSSFFTSFWLLPKFDSLSISSFFSLSPYVPSILSRLFLACLESFIMEQFGKRCPSVPSCCQSQGKTHHGKPPKEGLVFPALFHLSLTHTHTLSLSLSFFLPLSHALSLSLSFSWTHSLSISPSFTHNAQHSLLNRLPLRPFLHSSH